MCGIIGVWRKDNRINQERLLKIRDLMKHRGPDDAGFFINQKGNLGLTHCRLSIIDLSKKGHQPMSDKEKRFWITYNGELYNFKEIRAELEKKGYQFSSRTDTEVILYSYKEWRERCLQRFRGMFAFAIWDQKKKELFLARDPLGIKPLYYSWDGSSFVFASEAKVIANSELTEKQVNQKALISYLKLGFVSEPETIFQEIFSLQAGHYLVLKEGSFEDKEYWNLASCFKKEKIDFSKEEALVRLRKELEDSVKKHLISDVPLGIFLSGGVDSSSLVSLASKVSKTKLKTLSVVFPDTEYDESGFAKEVARKFNTDHSEIKISKPSLKSRMQDFLKVMDQPTIDGFNTYLVSLAAQKAGLKVCLSGLGGDELFGGYSSFFKVPWLYQLSKIFSPLDFLFEKFNNSKIQRITETLKNPCFKNSYLSVRSVFSDKEIRALTGEEASPLIHPVIQDNGVKEKVSFLELSCYMKNQLLRDSDVFSMAHSVELRVPFVDKNLVSFLGKVRPQLKYENQPNKKFLVEAVDDLPQEIFARKKKGFILPFEKWLRQEDIKRMTEKEFKSISLFNEERLQKLLQKFYNGKEHWSKIWSLLVLTKWLNENSISCNWN